MEKRARPDSKRGLVAAMVLLVPLLLAGCGTTVEPSDYRGLPDVGPRATYFTVVVKPGETLASIGARYDVSTSTIVHMNDLGRQDDVSTGEVLRIPASARRTREAVFHDATTGPFYATHAIVQTQILPPPPPPPVRSASNDTLPPPPVPQHRQHVHSNSPAAPPPMVPAPVVQASKTPDQPQQMPTSYGDGHFIWPLEGKIISTFGSVGNGERNDGINIAATMGEPIHAAAGGTVTYAGNELKGYGNLILIRHDDGYVTAYAHAQSIGVSRGDHVEKGQVIGQAGATGDVATPQLHFEIRRGVEPVDPKPLLMADRAS